MKLKQKYSLADKIADILNTAPTQSDPEDELDPETNAKITQDIHIEDDNVEEELLSKFRKQNVDFLSDIDERYAGKRAIRKDSQESDASSEDKSHEEKSSSESEEFEDRGDDIEPENASDDDVEEEETDEEQKNSDSYEEEYEDDEENFQHMKDTDVSAQLKKGVCVRNQINIFENLLEIRIQLQKSLIAANKMPPYDKFSEFKKEMGQEFSEKVSETKLNIGCLLDKLLALQNLVQKKYPETRKLDKNIDNVQDEMEDEVIPSDTDDEEEILEQQNENEDTSTPAKKRKLLSEYEKGISDNHKLYKSYRNNVIQKWHEKVRLTLMKNNAPSQSIVQHIEHTLSDRSKLLKRTQLKRSEYEILGEHSSECNTGNGESNSRLSHIYSTEIFDDDDFYHQLLRELIEMKSADMTDPVQLGRQWIQLQNLRNKMKRKIDTRATKGRKVRYTVHTKLINFMAPIEENSWTDQAKTELFGSLFGKNQPT